ncbi:DNA oxidative demethylase AlkB [Chitinimonas sp. BJB300]|uniref:DNA oxidative demethylase AlkB n=1 Tax=Chitinimonas sp. BJB300 TaxID=1559339 RepID=UPI001E4EFFED|nr:DNA oxidative demethylase AlkB [Chitinimonas sp. BJB300]
MQADLFADESKAGRWPIAPGAVVLHGFALPEENALLADITPLLAAAPFRQLVTPGGYVMSVAMSNCGQLGWVSDLKGYRYAALDPQTNQPWPAMPPIFLQLARRAAAVAGFAGFEPDACLINCYQPGARLSLHQDRNERDFDAPIVSVSLGLPATFLFGGLQRSDRSQRISLQHGDVVVWGGPARLRYHGVLALKPGNHPLLGAQRINLTFRKAG